MTRWPYKTYITIIYLTSKTLKILCLLKLLENPFHLRNLIAAP